MCQFQRICYARLHNYNTRCRHKIPDCYTQGVNGSCESGVLLYRAELKMSIYGMFLVGAEDLGDDGGWAIAWRSGVYLNMSDNVFEMWVNILIVAVLCLCNYTICLGVLLKHVYNFLMVNLCICFLLFPIIDQMERRFVIIVINNFIHISYYIS